MINIIGRVIYMYIELLIVFDYEEIIFFHDFHYVYCMCVYFYMYLCMCTYSIFGHWDNLGIPVMSLRSNVFKIN